ncbi:hypothetical protein N7507_004922 [Penicillium longicatenatum]|nr:hypothetical protein N7507_004922 [Penicillium longicatenatum]
MPYTYSATNISRENSHEECEECCEITAREEAIKIDYGERRRLQNRLSQRTYRRKKQMEKAMQLLAENQTQWVPTEWTHVSGPDLNYLTVLFQKEQERTGEASACRLIDQDTYELLLLFESAAYRSYIGNPSADHLLTLVKLNVFRAFERNISALGYTRSWMTDDAISRFSICGPAQNDLPQSLPAGLQPTALQKSSAHHPWLDFFPFAHMRDELIRNEESLDDSQLCRDLMGFWTMPTEGENCMIVWGDPWEPMNWEITETFLQKWSYLVKTCPEIIWSSNYWRRRRGEPKLKWKVSFKRNAA